MSTTAQVPVLAQTWIQKHEHVILALIAGLVLWVSIGRVDTLISNHDNANLQQAKIVAQVQQTANDALAKQIADQKTAFDVLNAQVQARDAQLVQLQTRLVTALAQQQATDKTLTPTALTARFNTLIPAAGAAVTVTGVSLPESGAVATVVELEKVPVLTQQLSASNEELEDANKLVVAEGSQITSLTALNAGLQAKAGDDAKVCVQQIATVKADARKSKRRWFLIGFVSGWISRQAVKTYTGL